MEIKKSSFRHKVREADIRHAVEHEIRRVEHDGWTMVFGPARSGVTLLEVGINHSGPEPFVFHAMPVRRNLDPHR